MAEAVKQLIANPVESAAMAAQAWQDVARYTWAAVREQWTAVYSGAHDDSRSRDIVHPSETPAWTVSHPTN
jgi:glycosyltransferase involved in cell wall biosynthesis